jgi:hypothetical protein
MANKFRGEMEIEIGEVKYLLRPSFAGLLEIEDKAGCGLMSLVQFIGSGKLTTRQTVSIIFGGIVGGGGKVEFEALGEECIQHGMLEISTKAAMFLAGVVQTRQKKVQEELQAK